MRASAAGRLPSRHTLVYHARNSVLVAQARLPDGQALLPVLLRAAIDVAAPHYIGLPGAFEEARLSFRFLASNSEITTLS